jgi:hypothetical protein
VPLHHGSEPLRGIRYVLIHEPLTKWSGAIMTNVPSGMPSSALPSSPAPTASVPVPPPEEDRHDHAVKRGTIWIARAVSYLVYAYLLIVEVILLMGFLLLLFGANPSSSFVDWAYRNLERAMRPFRGIFAPVEIGTAGNDVEAIFDTSIVFAMIMYAIVAIAVSALIGWLTSKISMVDRGRALDAAREQHENEIGAMRDRATIIEAQNAAAHVAAVERANAQQAATHTAPLATPPGGGAPSSTPPAPPPAPQL